MLTIQQIKENPQYVIDRLKVKGFDGKEKIEKILALDDRRRALQLQADTIAAGLNKQAAEIGKLMKAGEREAAEQKDKKWGYLAKRINLMILYIMKF